MQFCISLKCGNREIEDFDTTGRLCILELKVVQKLHFQKLGLASKPIFFKPQLHFIYTEFLCQKTVWINFTSDMILSRFFLLACLWNFKTLSSFQRLNIFCFNLLQYILNERDYELACHEQEARENKLLRILMIKGNWRVQN